MSAIFEKTFDERRLLAVDERLQIVGQIQLLQSSNKNQRLRFQNNFSMDLNNISLGEKQVKIELKNR
jgi:hypothetical protein